MPPSPARLFAPLLIPVLPLFAQAGSFAPQEHLGRLYASDRNPIVQEARLLGRYHGQ